MHHPDRHRAAVEPRPRGRRFTPIRLALIAMSAFVLALALPSPASAQPVVWATSPEDGAALDGAPGEIAVTFSETLDATASTLVLTGPDQAPIELEAPEFSDIVLIQPMRYTEPGDYTVTVSAVFADGQTLDTGFTFSVESIPAMLAVDGTGTENGDGAENGAGDEPAATADSDGTAPSLFIVVGAAALAALVVAGGIFMVRQRSRQERADAEQ